MTLKIPRSLAITAVAVTAAVASAAAFSACTPCPRVDSCYYSLQANPDGGNQPVACYQRNFDDGGSSCTQVMCPPVPSGCPVA